MLPFWSLSFVFGLITTATAGCRRGVTSTTTAAIGSETLTSSDFSLDLLSPVDIDRAQFNFMPYELTEVCLECSRPNTSVLYGCNIQFDWFDPNSVSENKATSCTCTYSWNWDGETAAQGENNTFDPAGFSVCVKAFPSMFEMRINQFVDPTNMTLMMSHFYKDSKLWGPPYLYPQTWAMPILTLTREFRNSLSMHYYMTGPILVTISGLED